MTETVSNDEVCIFTFAICLIGGIIIGLVVGGYAGYTTGNNDALDDWDECHGLTPAEYHTYKSNADSIQAQKEIANKTYLSGYEDGFKTGYLKGFEEDVNHEIQTNN